MESAVGADFIFVLRSGCDSLSFFLCVCLILMLSSFSYFGLFLSDVLSLFMYFALSCVMSVYLSSLS